jgi:hypothetical protein
LRAFGKVPFTVGGFYGRARIHPAFTNCFQEFRARRSVGTRIASLSDISVQTGEKP